MIINLNITQMNCWKTRTERDSNYNIISGGKVYDVEWIVIHYTANDGDSAWGNTNYFKGAYRGTSAHFFVDENSVWQSVSLDDVAWHCADSKSRNGCNNYNSIGVEICSRKNASGDYYFVPEAVNNAVELVLYLLTLYPKAKICRHYDVTGKVCPAPFVYDENQWNEFVQRIERGTPMTADEKKAFESLSKEVEELTARLDKYDKMGVYDNVAIKWAYNDGNIPAWAKSTVTKLLKKGYLYGNDKNSLELSYLMLRMLVILDRAGTFD